MCLHALSLILSKACMHLVLFACSKLYMLQALHAPSLTSCYPCLLLVILAPCLIAPWLICSIAFHALNLTLVMHYMLLAIIATWLICSIVLHAPSLTLVKSYMLLALIGPSLRCSQHYLLLALHATTLTCS